MAMSEMAKLEFTQQELEELDEIVGGRFDALVEIAMEAKAQSSVRADCERIAEELRPLVSKIRGARR